MMRWHGVSYQYISFRLESYMISPAKRLLAVVSAIALVAACSSNPTQPAPSRIAQPTAPRFDVDTSMCKSGYNIGQGRCDDYDGLTTHVRDAGRR